MPPSPLHRLILLTAILLLSTTLGLRAQDATNLISDTRLTADPATCIEGQRYYNTATHLGRLCTSTNTWSNLGAGTITAITVTGPITGGGSSGSVNLACATCAVTGTGLNQFSSTTSAQFLGVISDESGTGVVVGNNGPTFIAPILGAATATSVNKYTLTAPASGATLTILDGKTFKVDNTIELVGTDSAVYTLPSSTSTLASIGLTNTFTGRQNSTGAASTAPLKSGTTAGKPATCIVADLYFATDATAGQNIFECAATNTWTQQLNSGGGSGYSTIQVGGSALAQEPTANLIAGNGVTPSCVDNPGSTRTDCTFSANFAVALSIATAQAGKVDYCDDNTGTTAMTCSLSASAALLTYFAGQRFFLNPSVTCSTSCTLNIDTVGAKSIKQADGTTDPNGLLVANIPQIVWYDGVIFRLLATVGQQTIATKTTSFSFASGDNTILCDATSGTVTATLPTVVGIVGKIYTFKKIDASANACTLATTSSQTIDGLTTSSTTTQYNSKTVISNGAVWSII